jgi:hypothetical protein
MNKRFAALLFAVVAATALVGCSKKDPAEKAIGSVESALAPVREAAQKYVPDQLQAVNGQIAAAKDSLAKGDYAAVIESAPKLTRAIGDLKTAAEAKKAEVEAALAKAKEAWGPVSADLPKMIDAIQSRVSVLSKSHSLPSGITKDGLASAKSGVESLKSTLSDATAAAGSGDFTGAMAKAEEIKAKAGEIMQSLKMKAS